MVYNSKLDLVKSYSVYYNSVSTNKLLDYDLLILEPSATKLDFVNNLKRNGKIVIAYLSVLEISQSHHAFPMIKNDLIQSNGKYFINKEYNNYNVSLNSIYWTEYLINRIDVLLNEYGYDGVFFDTIGNIESNSLDINQKYDQISGFVNLLKVLRDKYKDIIMIQNNGFNLLIHYTNEYIDAICLENITQKGLYSFAFVKKVFNNLKKMQDNKLIKTLLLTENSDNIKKLYKLSNKYDFLWYDAPKNYLSII